MAANDAAKTNLNVRDALSYLDRVKLTFADQTEVYDRFLTIMKDFKSQGIDTPGVIDRVSTLFRGHPGLIQGFNTFLPPGYRIECSIATPADTASGVTTITVTTPMGMTTRTQLTGEQAAQAQAHAGETKPDTGAAGAQPAAPAASSGLHLQNLPSGSATPATSAIATPGAASVLANQPGAASQAQPAAAAPAPAAQQQAGADANRPPMEFNHAINYVNKIKNRFIREPETYKAFLEILQTYQKEGRAIQDVYAQVTTLFHSAPDLLDEFKQFLPDTSAEGQAAAAAAQQPAARAPAKRGTLGLAKDAGPAKRAKTASSKTAGVTDKSKGKRKADVGGSPIVGGPDRRTQKGASPADPHGMYLSDSTLADPHLQHAQTAAQYYYPPQAGQPGGYAPAAGAAGPPPVYAYDPPAPPPPPAPLLAPKPVPSQPDLAFFARVKAHAKDPLVYHEFLKLVNLYTQELIDLTALVSRAWLFLHQDAGLWAEFKEIVGWTDGVEGALGEAGKRVEVHDGRRVVENVPRMDGDGWRKSKGDAGKRWQTYGPSYRRLPPEEISLQCSGRDALCWEVLNDEWVSQPSYASDEGFVAQRKNPYEEALHRSEEERHEYDYHIEANLRTIALLEPIATRIALMEPDERATFRLKPGLGNQSKSIYQRVLKKVYGKEQGLEVIQALHDNPCVAVPIVLARLKQKDEEWKRALREWNRVWRESDAKNFLKALDHQAITLKANDKRFLTTKALVSEIEAVKRTQTQRLYGSHRPSPPPRWQLAYPVTDRQAVFDATRLTLSFLDRTYVVAFAEKPKVEAFLQEFLALVFALPPSEFRLETSAAVSAAVDEEETQSLLEGLSEAGTGTGSGLGAGLDDGFDGEPAKGNAIGGKKGKKGGDLRKKALKKTMAPAEGPGSGRGRKRGAAALAAQQAAAAAAAQAAQAGSAPSSRAGSPADGDSAMLDVTPAPEDGVTSREGSIDVTSIEGTPADLGGQLDGEDAEVIRPVQEKPPRTPKRQQWNLFANSTLYNLLRLFQILQHRLALLRSSAAVLATPPPQEPITPAHVPSLSMKLSYAPPTGDAWTSAAELYYQRALAICEKFFESEIDQATFEEALRRIMATQGYVLFTVDKILASILKLSLTATTDGKTRDLVNLLRNDRSHLERGTHSQQMAYRTEAESVLANDDNFYRIEWAPNPVSADEAVGGATPIDGNLRFQLMGKETVGPEDLPTLEREWAKYVKGYVKLDKTPDLPLEPQTPYLPRNLRQLGIPPPADAAASRPSLPRDLLVQSGLQTRICLRSYKLFFVAETEDVLVRLPSIPQEGEKVDSAADKADKRKLVRARKAERVERWLEKRKAELEALKDKPAPALVAKEATPAKEAPPAFAPARAAPTKAPEEKMEVDAGAEEAKKAAPAAVKGEKKEGEDVEMKA
ncbi:hypothetical protein JCM10207_001383 [Rhodosporidiobolus poonsookiae]